MYLEHLGVLQTRAVRRGNAMNEEAASKAKRVKTLVRAGELSRALRAVHDQPRLAVTTSVVDALASLYPRDGTDGQPNADMMQIEDNSMDMDAFRSFVEYVVYPDSQHHRSSA